MMRDPMSNPIREAIDDCLSGTEGRPSLEMRVLARVSGERRGPARLSAVMAIVLLATLLVATALAVGALAGLFRLEQSDVGSIQGCVSTGDTLYLMTSGGLRAWKPDEAEPTTLLSWEQMDERGASLDALIYRDGDTLGLLDQENKTIWHYRNGEMTRGLGYAGTAMDIPNWRYVSAVYQDGWLFLRALPRIDASVSDALLYRANPMTGEAEQLSLTNVTELCGYRQGGLLVLRSDVATREDRLAVLDIATGTIRETLATTPLQGLQGIAYDDARDGLYALVDGTLSRWSGAGWTALQGYAPHHLADGFAVVGDGYVSVSFNGMQYLPFAQENSLTTLTIRGYISTLNEDEDFQLLTPGVAVVRQREPALSAEDVRKAIKAGDTTDLFHLGLSGDLVALISEGLAAPLSSSDMLWSDAQAMLPVFRDALCWQGKLYAVPSSVMITAWQTTGEMPATLEEALERHAAWKRETPFIAWRWADETWTKKNYANRLLTTFIAEKARANERMDFRSEAFTGMLQLLRETTLPLATAGSGNAVIVPDVTVSLRGDLPDDVDSSTGMREYVVGATAPPPSDEAYWALPPAIGEGAGRTVPVWTPVYLLNPNAKNPEVAMAYLEYIASHRSLRDEAELKPDQAKPALSPAIERMIAFFTEEQRQADAEANVETDEAELKARMDAIRAAPDSWDVTADKLAEYRVSLAPHLDLRLHPLLAPSSKKDGGAYQQMLQAMMEYIEGSGSLEECLSRLEGLTGR